MSTHTPGPWRTGGTGGLIVFAIDGYAVANATVFHQKREEGESQANARLIASAPALLAACRAAEEVIHYPSGKTKGQRNEVLRQIHTAVKLAEGQG